MSAGGEGYFLSKLKSSKQCDCFGLELNDIAMAKAIQNGVKVTNEELEQHAQKNIEQYDVVTFFQVLEHIAEPGKFLHSVLKTVKKGGQIILTVPNNQPYYLKFDKFHLLNLPPHHMDGGIKNL
ncbi:MAG: methyltransferase domain-containing protein [Saprospiraceae bacterium]|nr:methyltransferase domain-containing protein [Saprospiraceae bacterium]